MAGLAVVVGRIMPVEEGLDELLAVQLVVVVGVVHLEVVELQLLVRHGGCVDGHLQMVLDVVPLTAQVRVVQHTLVVSTAVVAAPAMLLWHMLLWHVLLWRWLLELLLLGWCGWWRGLELLLLWLVLLWLLLVLLLLLLLLVLLRRDPWGLLVLLLRHPGGSSLVVLLLGPLRLLRLLLVLLLRHARGHALLGRGEVGR